MSEPKRALLVIDLQTGMRDELVDHQQLIAHAKALIAWARNSDTPVAFVRHDGPPGDGLAPGAPGWPVDPALGQIAQEPTFSKSVGDAFSRPELEAWLRANDVDELILAGAQTDQCVKATLGGALRCGFAVTVAADAHGTCDWNGETAPQIIARHNAMFVDQGARLATTAQISGASN
jgi:nicotinamidase-related amidase